MDKSKIPMPQRAAIGMLLDDHRSVKKLFKAFEAAKDAEKKQIATQTCMELTVHAELEEELFYPAMRGVSEKMDSMLDEAEVEHQVAKDLIAKIEAGSDAAHLEANYKVLAEYVGHHVEEEETEMFPAVIKSEKNLKELAAQMESRKAELMAAA